MMRNKNVDDLAILYGMACAQFVRYSIKNTAVKKNCLREAVSDCYELFDCQKMKEKFPRINESLEMMLRV